MRVLMAVALVLGLVICGRAGADAVEKPQLPTTPKKTVSDEYYGIKVTDDYRWLENGGDPGVRKWAQEQTRYTRAFLDKLPALDSIRKRLKELNSGSSPDYTSLAFRGDRLFALKSQPPKDQPFLITLKSADDPGSEHIVVDPNKLNPKGTTAIDFYVPSLDGRLAAVSLSEGGSEEGTVHVYEVDSGRELGDVIPRVNYATAGGSVAWNADGSGLYYTRYPRGNERPKEDRDFYQQVYFHKLGTPTDEDVYSLGKEFPRIAETVLETSKDGRHVLASVANGDGGEFAHYLLGESGHWTQFTHFSDKIIAARFGLHDDIYVLSRQNAPRGKILRLPRNNPELTQAKNVVSESSDAVIEAFVPTVDRLYVVDLVGGPSQIRVFDLFGMAQKPVSVPPVSAVGQVVRMHGDEVLFRTESYTQPPAWYRFDPAAGTAKRTALYRTSPADFSDVEVVREFATSKDGTKVPINIIQPRGTRRDGNNPTVLYGYGGYSISVTPTFRVGLKAWLEQGCIYAIANLRGGGEYGEEWHHAGNLTHKQNVFDDFAACAQHLIAEKVTNPRKLAIEGGSNGGLLMGAALTQHPELFRAVVSHVGIYDMLRVELSPNGAFNVTEFGTVKDPDQFKALYAYSPYHHVKDDARYPAVLFLTGENDGRVDPANSRKMTARLQATSTADPVLLRVSFSSGHGIGTGLGERIAQQADVDAFLFDALGVEYRAGSGSREPASGGRD
jgi:prolyl oligopeptidase